MPTCAGRTIPATSGSCWPPSVATAILAYATGEVAARRGDGRLFLVSLGFLAAAGFLGLHALATPKVLLDGPNGGFVLATPVGRRPRVLLAAVRGARRASTALHAVWPPTATPASRAPRPSWPLGRRHPPRARTARRPARPSRARGLTVLALVAVALYCSAAYATRPSTPAALGLLLAVVDRLRPARRGDGAVGFARNWHASWWEWHLLISGRSRFRPRRPARVARGALQRLYLDRDRRGQREVSVVFADLSGFTAFSDGRDPRRSPRCSTPTSSGDPADRQQHGGDRPAMGDALMATFNTRADQPDHAERAAAAALAFARDRRGRRRSPTGPASGSASTPARSAKITLTSRLPAAVAPRGRGR